MFSQANTLMFPCRATAVSGSITLDPTRVASAAFTVTNQGSRPFRARLRPMPMGASQAGWFTVKGPAEREFPAGITQQVLVQVAVPANVAFGHYLFRLDVIGLENPDEDLASTSAVAFDIAGTVPHPPVLPAGYLATLEGAVIGGVAVGAVGAVPAAIYALTNASRASVSSVQAVLVIGSVLGSWVGVVAGVLSSLRFQGFDGAGPTALLLGASYPVVAALLAFIGVRLGLPGFTVAALIFLTLPALTARYLYILRWRKA